MFWSLYEEGKFLEPLKFSNGKTQEDVTKEILEEIQKGNKIIFIKGICGTGKSAIALNLSRKLGKTSIIVPIKSLQMQYKRDYETSKYVLKSNKEKLKISVITGRNNHKCPFLEENKKLNSGIKREINSKLHDIFEGKRKEEIKDISADNFEIPCKIELKERNFKKIKEYLKQNKDIDHNKFENIKDVKRVSVAGACPYWSPVISNRYELGGKSFVKSKKRKYIGLEDNKFIFYFRKSGCKFYEQFNEYLDSDVIVFNSLKYKLESLLNRKPLTEAEIIDECDEFLDNFSNSKEINLERLQNSLIKVISFNENTEKIIKELIEIIHQIKKDKKISNSIISEEIIPLKKTGIYDLLKIFSKSYDLFHEIDEESYVFNVQETARLFEDFFEESYVIFNKKENNLIASVVTTNLAKRLREMINKNKIIILMSGTLHSEEILKNIFGLENFKIIEAETQFQGKIKIKKTGLEKDCKYSNFYSGKHSRENYLRALDKCLEIAEKPILVHVNAFIDLPTKEEIKEFKIHNLISREELKEIQNNDKTGKLIKRFKKGEIDVLFSTKCSRGMDFPGKECNSIIFTKYPNPNVKEAFWRVLMNTKPQYYWSFYKDKAKRELLQKVYRGLRSKEDQIYLLSPDSRVLEAFEKDFYRIKI